MSETSAFTAPQPFPVSQRELVGLALNRGVRRPVGPSAPHSQRDRVRLALALGVGGDKPVRAARRGIYR